MLKCYGALRVANANANANNKFHPLRRAQNWPLKLRTCANDQRVERNSMVITRTSGFENAPV
eukprot:6579812-Heterocapsa_arctica.AAC.1